MSWYKVIAELARKAVPRPLTNRVATSAPLTAGIGVSMTERVARANRWREGYNPLRGITVARAVAMIEQYSRGEFTDLMWAFGAPYMGIECADPDLLALIERRTSAIRQLDWKIRLVDEDREDFDEALAKKQAAQLREVYDGICNLKEAITHLALASFRGFSHLELVGNADGDLTELRLVDQWNVVRDGMNGDWKYNPDALSTSFAACNGPILEPERFIIREVARPINRWALIKFVRANLSEKDWDAFIEIYGIPGGIVTLPPNVPADKEPEYLNTAEEISKGGHGALPNGSTYTANGSTTGAQPFRPRLDYLSEKLVLAGTGGLLTMLTQSGSGTLAGSAHQEAFDSIARAEGGDITERLQRSIDRAFFATRFPGQPQLAYFCLDTAVKKPKEVLELAVLAKNAGLQMDAEEVSEDTGYTITVAPQPVAQPSAFKGQPLDNRARSRALLNAAGAEPVNPQFAKAARRLAALGAHQDLKPILDRLEAAMALPDDEMILALEKLRADKVKLLKAVNGNKALDEALDSIFGPMLAQGLTTPAPVKNRSRRSDALLNFDPDQPRAEDGKFAEAGAGGGADGNEGATSEAPAISDADEEFHGNFDDTDPDTYGVENNPEFEAAAAISRTGIETADDLSGPLGDEECQAFGITNEEYDRAIEDNEFAETFDRNDPATWGGDTRTKDYTAQDGTVTPLAYTRGEDLTALKDEFDKEDPKTWGLSKEKADEIEWKQNDLNTVAHDDPASWSGAADSRISQIGDQYDAAPDRFQEEAFAAQHSAEVKLRLSSIRGEVKTERAAASKKISEDLKSERAAALARRDEAKTKSDAFFGKIKAKADDAEKVVSRYKAAAQSRYDKIDEQLSAAE